MNTRLVCSMLSWHVSFHLDVCFLAHPATPRAYGHVQKKSAKLKERQKWSHEKLHLVNARKLRGIYFIDPEDKEFKETIKNARKKIGNTSCSCSALQKLLNAIRNVGVVHPIKSKNLRVFWKPVNLQDCVWENQCRLTMKTILQEKETIHHSIINWFTNLFLCLTPRKFPQQKQ